MMVMETLFGQLSLYLGLPMDKVRYGCLYFTSFPLALVLRIFLNYKYTSSVIRHLFCIMFGILYCWLCFQWQVFYLLAFVSVGYILLLTVPSHRVHTFTLWYVLTGVSVGHVYRMLIDYGNYTLDFSVPLMLLVQRISYVAYAYHDGASNSKLSSDQERQKISELPSLLEYFSYNFSFLTILAGPTSTYKEYDDFITGRNMQISNKDKVKGDPSPLIPAGKKLAGALFCLSILLLNEDKMDNARVLVESISNTGGLGFSGYSKDGVAKWDLVRCVDVLKFEFGKNIREQTLAWNIFTQTWLKRIVYERYQWNPVLLTCLVSAIWHGFYPGYYVSFIFVALVTETARKLRLLLWHRFQSPRVVKILYDIATIAITNFGKDLVILTFWLLTLENVVTLWSYYRYIPFIVVALIALVLPSKKKQSNKI
ncbi:PREDICTED: lysophospholipid acyltransferase 2-like isoform X2 [Amphimedon queenslandica]|uniref:Uncharacterized protein n=1 Tax=Amphimedon queenslandica TaxID=400682 RepID=A0AAN0JIL4_AMPQE|nr:PREDICTED: lysophospholipid acyltransferase 2-like isoform X2 [Amphimedon queenslandica]|eukprot:XP_019856612.1 PREDICTED: lysophospholipid acyltransferase 2-like isoform X2 [Amphimedon queenslandica]